MGEAATHTGEGQGANGTGQAGSRGERREGTWTVKRGLAQMLKGGVIMDVVTPEQARLAEDAGAVAVMALERVPADIRAAGGVARMSDPELVAGIIAAVTIPVMAKARIGHFVEAQVLEALGVDYVDESEVLTPADEEHHIDKHAFKVPFVCGCPRPGGGPAPGRRGGGDAAHQRGGGDGQRGGGGAPRPGHPGGGAPPAGPLRGRADGRGQAPGRALRAGPGGAPDGAPPGGQLRRRGDRHAGGRRLDDAAGGGRGVRRVGNLQERGPARRAKAIVQATTHFRDPAIIAEVSKGLGGAMPGLEVSTLPPGERLAARGW